MGASIQKQILALRLHKFLKSGAVENARGCNDIQHTMTINDIHTVMFASVYNE